MLQGRVWAGRGALGRWTMASPRHLDALIQSCLTTWGCELTRDQPQRTPRSGTGAPFMNSFATYERAAEDEPNAAPDRRRRRLLAALPLALLTAVAAAVSNAHAKAEPLEPDEDVLFLRSTARQLEDGRIEVDLQAWIHEKDRQKILDAGLARYLGLNLSTMSPAARLRYAQRTSLFQAEPEEGTVLEIDFGHPIKEIIA